ncbi:MAG TPA: hypothetical protein VHF22_01340 [Planctomycetota bacterium]|nr:hypothetical protein [Planctomycetota bacterium]
MAKAKSKHGLPDAIERREILAGSAKRKVDVGELGRRYLGAGFFSDAIDCFERAADREKLAEIKRIGIERDVFLLARLAKVAGFEVKAEEWREAGVKALAAGRDRSATIAFERAGDAERAAEAKAKVDALRAELPQPKKGRGGLEIG